MSDGMNLDETYADSATSTPAATTFGNFVLGAAGTSLLRNWYAADAHERRERLIGLAEAYGSDELMRFPVPTDEYDPAAGYALWATAYDAPGNPMTQIEQPLMVERIGSAIVDGTVALDAGCGTGRLSAELVALGYETIGVDITTEMLDLAEASVPAADFRRGAFEQLPVDDNAVDLITSGLAVCHALDLDIVFAEFARVLRPGGRIVMSNPHPFTSGTGGQAFFSHDGGLPFVRNHAHQVGAYVTALLAHGFTLTGMADVPYDETVTAQNPAYGQWPDVVNGALLGQPFVLIIEASFDTSTPGQ